MTGSRTKSLVVVGLGINPGEDATLAAVAAIRQVRLCATIDSTNNFLDFVSRYNKNVANISYLYTNHDQRAKTYELIVDTVLKLVDEHDEVAYLTYGSSSLLDTPSSMLMLEGRRRGYNCSVIPGISFSEKFFSLVSHHVDRRGLNLVLAKTLIEGTSLPNARQPLIIAQLIETGHLDEKKMLTATPNGLGLITEALRQFYRADHYVLMFHVVPWTGELKFWDVQLTALPLLWKNVNVLTSLFVPPIPSPAAIEGE